MRVFDIHRELLEGLALHAIDLANDDARARNSQLETFAPHVFEQDRKVQLAAPEHHEHIGVGGVLDPKRHIGQELLGEPFAEVPAGDVLAFPARQG